MGTKVFTVADYSAVSVCGNLGGVLVVAERAYIHRCLLLAKCALLYIGAGSQKVCT